MKFRGKNVEPVVLVANTPKALEVKIMAYENIEDLQYSIAETEHNMTFSAILLIAVEE